VEWTDKSMLSVSGVKMKPFIARILKHMEQNPGK